jgi:hypothetical protein
MAWTISGYGSFCDPPLEITDAVSDATPSFPAGSDALPVRKRIRKETSGEELGRRTVSIFADSWAEEK